MSAESAATKAMQMELDNIQDESANGTSAEVPPTDASNEQVQQRTDSSANPPEQLTAEQQLSPPPGSKMSSLRVRDRFVRDAKTVFGEIQDWTKKTSTQQQNLQGMSPNEQGILVLEYNENGMDQEYSIPVVWYTTEKERAEAGRTLQEKLNSVGDVREQQEQILKHLRALWDDPRGARTRIKDCNEKIQACNKVRGGNLLQGTFSLSILDSFEMMRGQLEKAEDDHESKFPQLRGLLWGFSLAVLNFTKQFRGDSLQVMDVWKNFPDDMRRRVIRILDTESERESKEKGEGEGEGEGKKLQTSADALGKWLEAIGQGMASPLACSSGLLVSTAIRSDKKGVAIFYNGFPECPSFECVAISECNWEVRVACHNQKVCWPMVQSIPEHLKGWARKTVSYTTFRNGNSTAILYHFQDPKTKKWADGRFVMASHARKLDGAAEVKKRLTNHLIELAKSQDRIKRCLDSNQIPTSNRTSRNIAVGDDELLPWAEPVQSEKILGTKDMSLRELVNLPLNMKELTMRFNGMQLTPQGLLEGKQGLTSPPWTTKTTTGAPPRPEIAAA